MLIFECSKLSYLNTQSTRKKSEKQMRNAAGKVEELRRKQNEHLLAILEEEQLAEAARETKIKKAQGAKEREKLQKKFDVERAAASERIIRITVSHPEPRLI